MFDALKNRDFAFFWSAAAISNAGNWMQALSIPYIVYELTKSNTWLGVTGAALFLPCVVGTACIGALVDRYDRRRLLLCGVSSGATGAWNLAVREPSRFAGLLIVGGLVGPSPAVPASEAVVSTEVEDPHRWLAQRLRQLPIWIHHGDGDPLFPVHDARRTAAALRAEGAAMRYSELPGFGHNVWDVAFYSEEVLRWLLKQKRPVTDHLGARLP